MSPIGIPATPIRTARLLLRSWEPGDAPRFKRSLDASLPELRRWIPWARDEPSELSVLEARLAGYESDFVSGGNALYAILDPDGAEILGGVGLYRRVGPGALEIGYWIRSDLAGRGLATEATEALTHVGLAVDGIERIEIRCDPENAASAAVPRKLGYRHVRTIETPLEEGGTRLTMVWELTSAELHGTE